MRPCLAALTIFLFRGKEKFSGKADHKDIMAFCPLSILVFIF
jgi:hypothetical protein